MVNMPHATHKTGDDWGMVYGIVLPTLPEIAAMDSSNV